MIYRSSEKKIKKIIIIPKTEQFYNLFLTLSIMIFAFIFISSDGSFIPSLIRQLWNIKKFICFKIKTAFNIF